MKAALSLRWRPRPAPPAAGARPSPSLAGSLQDPPDDDVGPGRNPIATAKGLVGANLAAKAASVALIGCLVAGPAGLALGGLALAGASAPAVAPQTQVVDQAGARAVAGEFAQRLVVTWLTTSRDKPDALTALVADAQLASLPAVPYTVTDPTVAGITAHDGLWSVTVAATVTDARKQVLRRFYQVPVSVTGGPAPTVTALMLPSPVAPPVIGSGARLAYGTQVETTGPVASTVSQFLAAYTAGQGDVTRYVSPGVQLSAITPAPYVAVKIDDLRATGDGAAANPQDGQLLHVLVSATATVTAKQSSPVTYALTLKARSGRWEVAEIDPTPALLTTAARTTS